MYNMHSLFHLYSFMKMYVACHYKYLRIKLLFFVLQGGIKFSYTYKKIINKQGAFSEN